MKRALRVVAIVLGVLVTLVLVAWLALESAFAAKLAKVLPVQPVAIVVPTDAASVAEGHRLVASRGCADCHGADLGGRKFFDEPALGAFVSTNLTRGKGGKVTSYSDADLARLIRDGIYPDGHVVRFMPSHEYHDYSDDETGKLIAAIRAMPPVDREPEPWRYSVLFKALATTGAFPFFTTDRIDYSKPREAPPVVGANVGFGKYLARGCTGCHGDGLSGGPIPGAPASVPVPRNLTPDDATGLGKWTVDDFKKAMRTGVRPDGTKLNAFMPYAVYKNATDDELAAMYLYFKSLPKKPFGGR